MSTVLVISPEPWDGHFVSKHHYACELARRGHQVLFYGPPDAAGPMRLVPVTDAPGNLRVVHAPRVAPGLRFLPNQLRRALEARWLGQVEQIAGQPIDVVWNFENSRFFDMRFAGQRLKIYQQVDLNQDFHPAQAAMSADIAVALNGSIVNRLRWLGVDKPVHLVSHGLTVAAEGTVAPDLPTARVNAAYIGNLGIRYLDVEAFSEVVRQHGARVLFHLFGSFDETMPLRRALEGRDNVIWYGWQDPQAVYRHLSAMDIAMVIYRTEMDLEQISNSHKILEYLHSGAVVASSFLLDYKERPDLIEMAPLDGSYPDLFASVLARLDVLNTWQQRHRRKAYSLEHTYPKKLDQIEEIVAAQCQDTPLTARPLTGDQT
jgi:glycosyltransferase involved in cell wall biosynthesis